MIRNLRLHEHRRLYKSLIEAFTPILYIAATISTHPCRLSGQPLMFSHTCQYDWAHYRRESIFRFFLIL